MWVWYFPERTLTIKSADLRCITVLLGGRTIPCSFSFPASFWSAIPCALCPFNIWLNPDWITESLKAGMWHFDGILRCPWYYCGPTLQKLDRLFDDRLLSETRPVSQFQHAGHFHSDSFWIHFYVFSKTQCYRSLVRLATFLEAKILAEMAFVLDQIGGKCFYLFCIIKTVFYSCNYCLWKWALRRADFQFTSLLTLIFFCLFSKYCYIKAATDLLYRTCC